MCDKLVHPAYYNRHFSACRKSNDDCVIDARNKQIIQLNNEVGVDNDESDDGDNDDSNSDVNETERTLVAKLDDYIPVQRNKRVDTCAYYNPLLRIESLQYYDISCSVAVDSNQTIEFAEWAPKRCEKDSERCNVTLHGIFVRFCFDTDEPFYLRSNDTGA